MRIGFNPNKDQKIAPTDFFHQVIVPVHIPNQEGYFKDSFQIFQYCLESLFKTSHSNTFFTVVNNGSNKEVEDFLNELHRQGKIHEVVHTTAIGKLNAILKGLAGHQFSLVTISDADVLFLNGWQEATYEVYEAFPKTGAVCPTPSSKVLKHFTANVLLDNFFSSRLKFTEVENKESLKMFAASIGNPEFYNDTQLNKNLSLVSNDGVKAVVGAGHFVATYRAEIYTKPSAIFFQYKMGNILKKFLDEPVMKKGYWRLSTSENYAYHMGNIAEDWMSKILSNQKDVSNELKPFVKLKHFSSYGVKVFFQILVFNKILSRKKIWKLFLRYKGLSKYEANQY